MSEEKWMLSDKQYNILKKVLINVVPPLIALIAGLGSLYNFDANLINGTIGLFATFFAGVLGVSKHNYNAGKGE
jgi:hypothetical protein